MKTVLRGTAALLVLVVLAAGAYGYWNMELRWRPKTITRHQAEIAKILQESGWVSPGLAGPKLYMVSSRACPECARFKAEAFPGLHAVGVDTRVIEIAPADKNGVVGSTPVERATVAELWVNRSWSLARRWDAAPAEAWTAPGIKPADGDIARTAVIEAGRANVETLIPLMKDNGVGSAWPLLVWWTRDGQMRACACAKRESYRFVRKELGA